MLLLAYKLIRPILPITSGMAAWIIAQSCGANSVQSIFVAVSIALSTIGASFYHFGGANWMYARKSDRLKFENPETVRLIGLAIFSLSIGIAIIWLPKECALICLFNTLVIAAYSVKLSSHWLTKNITMSVISATPIIIGWFAGIKTHPIVPWAIGLAFVAHLAREIIKDVKDILSNEGKRVTLPMVLGTEHALQISGILLLIATVLPLLILQFADTTFQITMVVSSALVLLITGMILLFSKKAGRCETLIHVSLCLILLALCKVY